jgi:hypothetical protein
MVHLFDIMRQAQQGAVLDNWSRQFGLSVLDTQRTVEALLPAFSLGLQNAARDPGAFARLLETMMSGRYAPIYDGRSLPGPGAGGDALLQLFGSPEAAQRIATQVSAMSGVGAQVVQQMMPVMAATLMGGLSKYASLEGLSGLLRQWADWLQAAQARVAPRPAARPGPEEASARFYAAWSDLVGSFFGGAARPPERRPDPVPTDPWSAMLTSMSALGRPAEPQPPPPPPQPNPFEPLAQMFQTGREVQAQHLAGLQSIMDSVWGARPANGPTRG